MYPSMTDTMMYCIPEKEVAGNFPVRSECIVSVRANTCVYVWLLIELSGTGCVLSSKSLSISVNNDTNLLVEFCPCRTWSKWPSAVGVVWGGFVANIVHVSRVRDGM